MTSNEWKWILGGAAALVGLAVVVEAGTAHVEKKAVQAVGRKIGDEKRAIQQEALMVGKQTANTALNAFVPGLGVFFPKGIIK